MEFMSFCEGIFFGNQLARKIFLLPPTRRARERGGGGGESALRVFPAGRIKASRKGELCGVFQRIFPSCAALPRETAIPSSAVVSDTSKRTRNDAALCNWQTREMPGRNCVMRDRRARVKLAW